MMQIEADCLDQQRNLINAAQQLDPIIDRMQADIVRAVSESVRIESTRGVSTKEMPFGDGPTKALQHALTLSDRLGFHTKNLDNAVGYTEFGEGDEMIAVLGHLDVVPAGEGWKYPPFGGEIHEETLWGRGTLDDKGPIIGALFAMKAVESSGLKLSRRIRIIFGTNEETGSEDIPIYTNTQEAPVLGFTPDASYPVIFAEKGILTFSLSKKIDQNSGCVKLVRLSGGTAANVVPALAEAVVSKLDEAEKKYEGFGLASHGSTPELGKNAIISLIRKLENLDFSSDLKRYFTFLSEHIGEETNGKSMGIQMQDDKSGSLTLNLAIIRLQETQEINAIINIRYPVTKKAEDILQTITSLVSGTGIKVTLIGHKEPLYVEEDSELIKKLQMVYEQRTGEKAELIAIGGGTYAKAMKNVVAFGPLFPGQDDLAHQVDEHISVKDLIKNIKIMASAMYLLAK